MGEQLLPSAPTQSSGKASPYLAILLTCLFPFHSASFSKQSLPFVVHHPGQASVTFPERGRGGEVLGSSWTSAARGVVGLEGSEVLQHGPDVCMWATEPHLYPQNQQHLPHGMGDWERTAGGRKLERRGSRRKRKERRREGDGTSNFPVTFISFS